MEYQIGVGEWVINQNKPLGKGSYGSVFVCHKEGNENELYAAKKIPLSGNIKDTKKINNELSIFSKMQNSTPYLVKMHSFKKTTNSVYIIMDLCDQGSLQSYMRKYGLQINQALDFMQKICLGYKALREKKILHRDLKPDNILLDKGVPKITDFGLGRIFENMEQLSGDQTKSLVGSEYYMAPELLEYVQDAYKHGRLMENPHYSDKSDVWSMGMVFYYMLSIGQRPWEYGTQGTQSQFTEFYLNQIKQKPILLSPQWPLEAQHLLLRMLTVNEKERISWDEVFQHPLVNPSAIQNMSEQQVTQIFQQDIQRYFSNYHPQLQQQPQQYQSYLYLYQQNQQQFIQGGQQVYTTQPTQNVQQNYMPKKRGDSMDNSMDNMEEED